MSINQVKVGAILSYVIIFVNNVVGLIYTPFMLRMMGQNEYGLYSLVSSVVAYLTILDFGFNNTIVRYTAKYRAEGKEEEQYKMFGMFFLVYCIISFVTIVIGTILYANIDNLFDTTMTLDDLYKIKIMVLLMIANIAFTFPMSIWGGIITAYEKFVFQKMLNLSRVILNPLCMSVLLMIGYKAIALVVITTLFNVIILILNAIYCRKKLKIKIRFGKLDIGFFKEVFAFSVWIFLCAIVDRLYWSSGQFILGIYVNAIEIAVFAIAVQIQAFYGSFSFAISGLLLPRVMRIIVNNEDNKEISDLFIKIGRILTYPMSLLLCCYILFGKHFVILWAGEEYSLAYNMTLCFIVPELFTAIQQMGYSILQAQNRVKFRAISQLVVSSIAITVCIPLAKHFGGIGCAFGIGLGIFIGNVIIINIYYHNRVGINMIKFWKEILHLIIYPIMISLCYSIVLCFFTPNSIYQYILHITVFSLMFIVGTGIFNFNEYEKNLIVKPILRILK